MSRHGSTLCSPTVEKPLCRSPISQRSHVGNLRQTIQGKGRSSKRKGNRRCPFLFAPRGGCRNVLPSADGESPPLRFSEKLSARQGRTRLRQFAHPSQLVLKKEPHVRGEHAYAVRVPRSAGAEKPPARFAFPRLPYTTKAKKAPLTRCLSLLWICRPLSSSSCRNYRSRRRYYHHRYRKNRSRRCPDRSIPRSG